MQRWSTSRVGCPINDNSNNIVATVTDLVAILTEPTSSKEAEAEADNHSNEQGKPTAYQNESVALVMLISPPFTEMDVEQDNDSMKAAESRSRSSGRIHKKGRGKAKAAMVFPVYRKGKRVGPHLNKRQRRKSLRP